ncbi:MAG TPA: xanthine dehydrogenase family protein subunit M [Actinomycetota bacterium]|nr:xanthine dehydrogenase family protein subunit M [Actinomycetota bacterium]
MIPAEFEYEVAESAEHAVALLGEHGDDAKLLAGGHSLLPLMRLRLAYPSVLVDVGRIPALNYIRDEGDTIAIGALTRHEGMHFDETLQQGCPIVADVAGEIGDPQVRNCGTIGGSLAHGDPAGDLPSVMVALDAQFVVQGPGGTRTVAARDFFKGVFETDLSAQEMLTEVRVPKLRGAGWSYVKFAHRAQDWATVGVAVIARRSNGASGEVSVALTSMGETPLRARGVEEALAAGRSISEAAERADEGTNPVSDPMGSAEYRRAMSKVLTARALEEALSRR